MRIKVCSHGLYNDFKGIAVNPTALFLKTYYDLYGLNKNTVWLTPDTILLENIETIVKNLLSEKIDILGLGIYVWNESIQFKIAKQIKKEQPNIVIVAGGPQLAVHKDDKEEDNFFIDHPYINYVVYGDGEKPFQQIIDYESGIIDSKENFVNIVEPDNNFKRKIYPLEILNDHDYLNTSPFFTNKKVIEDILESLKSKGIDDKTLIWPVEFARGCMYGCTFCDWSQNLTKKVKRRTHNWKQDIDLFIELDQKIRETDANFGMWKEDIEIFDYCISKFDPNKNFGFHISNMPKLKKEITEYIITKSLKTYNTANLKFALQDVNEDVLSAIDRPSVSWERISEMINYFKSNLTENQFSRVQTELIVGLPGQTIDHWIENLVKLYLLGITNIMMYDYYYLKNSPAADKMYKKIWGIETGSVYRFYTDKFFDPVIADNLENIYYDLKYTEKYSLGVDNYTTFIKTKHMSEIEITACKYITRYFLNFVQYKQPRKNFTDIKYNESVIRKHLARLKEKSLQEAQIQYEYHRPLIEKYGFRLSGKYDIENKVYRPSIY